MPDIAAGPGSLARAVRRMRVHPAPLPPEAIRPAVTQERPIRAGRRVLLHPCGQTRLRTTRCLSPTSATDLRHEHPLKPPDSPLERLAAPFAWVEHRLTPTSSFGRARDALRWGVAPTHRKRGAPYRYGASHAAALSAPRGLAARPLTLPVAPRRRPRERGLPDSQARFPHALVKERSFHEPERLPSTGASGEARHRTRGFATAEPASGALESPPRFAPGWARRTASRGSLPLLAIRHVGRRLSTSAIDTVSEHDHGSTEFPAHLAGSHPPAGRCCRQPCASRRKAGRTVLVSGAGETEVSSALPRERVAWSCYPEPFRSGHLLSRSRVPGGWSLRSGIVEEEPKFPRDRRRPAHEAPSARGLHTTTPSRKGTADAHPRCLPSKGEPKPGAVVHRLSPACGFPEQRLSHRRDFPRLSTCREMRRRDRAWESASRFLLRGRSVPNRLLRFGSSAARCAEIGRAHV